MAQPIKTIRVTNAGDMSKLNAENMKGLLWDCLQGVAQGETDTSQALAIAAVSREILSVVKTQYSILKQENIKPTQKMLEYATDK